MTTVGRKQIFIRTTMDEEEGEGEGFTYAVLRGCWRREMQLAPFYLREITDYKIFRSTCSYLSRPVDLDFDKGIEREYMQADYNGERQRRYRAPAITVLQHLPRIPPLPAGGI